MHDDPLARVSEWPLVSRQDCWRAYRPAQPFSESAFQRLRREGVVSPGVRFAQRRDGVLSGQARYFSRLNLLALEAYRTGDAARARGLSSLAAELEDRDDLQRLAEDLAGSSLTSAVDPRSLPTGARVLVRSVCVATDGAAAKTPDVPRRLTARVARFVGEMADLVLAAGGHVLYSRRKLADIGRDRPGASLVIYMVDLGGSDELVRARPAVDLDEVSVDDVDSCEPGAFTRLVTDVRGADAATLVQTLQRPASPRLLDLTGLQFLP